MEAEDYEEVWNGFLEAYSKTKKERDFLRDISNETLVLLEPFVNSTGTEEDQAAYKRLKAQYRRITRGEDKRNSKPRRSQKSRQ